MRARYFYLELIPGGARRRRLRHLHQGAYALGTAFAGVASGSAGLPSIYWNPASITRFEGRNLSAGATLVFPYADITPQPNGSLVLPLEAPAT